MKKMLILIVFLFIAGCGDKSVGTNTETFDDAEMLKCAESALNEIDVKMDDYSVKTDEANGDIRTVDFLVSYDGKEFIVSCLRAGEAVDASTIKDSENNRYYWVSSDQLKKLADIYDWKTGKLISSKEEGYTYEDAHKENSDAMESIVNEPVSATKTATFDNSNSCTVKLELRKDSDHYEVAGQCDFEGNVDATEIERSIAFILYCDAFARAALDDEFDIIFNSGSNCESISYVVGNVDTSNIPTWFDEKKPNFNVDNIETLTTWIDNNMK